MAHPRALARATRYVLRSSPRLFWTLTLVLASLVAAFVANSVADAQRLATSLGATTPVVVATRSLEPSTVVVSSDVRVVDRSTGWVPEGAVLDLDAAIGARVVEPIVAGEALVATRLGGAGATSLGADERGMAVPVPDGLTLNPGDPVDLASPLWTDRVPGRVLFVAERSATVAVSAGDATRVALVRTDQIVLLLAPDLPN